MIKRREMERDIIKNSVERRKQLICSKEKEAASSEKKAFICWYNSGCSG